MRPMFAFVAVAFLAVVSPAGAEETERFFPPGVWGKPKPGSNRTQAEQDQFYEDWFGKRLGRENERPLWVHRANAGAALSIRMSVYRGTVVPDFSMIRLAVMPDGRMTYHARDYAGCPVKGKPAVIDLGCMKPLDREGSVDPATAARVMSIVERIAPLAGKTPSQVNDAGLDGTETVFEFADGKKFNAIKRWELGSGNGGDLARLEEVLTELGRQIWRRG